MTAPRHVDVGAYVLGILDEPDEAAYEEHFTQCEQCRREFIEMADLPAILDTMKPAKSEPQRGQQPVLPPLDALIDFRQLSPPGQAPPGPAVPPQLRPSGATQPHRIPSPEPTNGRRTNGSARAAGGHPIPTPKPADRPRAEGTGRHTPVSPKRGPGPAGTTSTPRAESTGRSTPVPGAEGRNPAAPAPRTDGRPRPASRAESTGRSAPVSRAEGTGRSAPVPRPESTGRSAPVARPEGTGRSISASRAEGTGRALPVASRPSSTKPPSKPQTSGPTGRRGRKHLWVAAAAVAAVALSVGMVIGLTPGDPGGQVADPGTSAPQTPTSGAVAGAHVVSGTDPKSGITAIITIEPVTDGTEIEVALYELAGAQEGEIFVVSRFGDRERVATWNSDGKSGTTVRTTGVSAFAQHDISRFEVHGAGTVPLLVVPI